MQDSPRSFQKFQKIPLIFSIVFLICSCILYFFLHKAINENKKISEQMHIEWQTEADRRDEIKSLDRSIRAIEKEKTMLESHFAQSSDIVPFLDTIENLSERAQAKSEVISVNILDDKTGLSVEVRTTGSFEAVYKFLILLENSPYELEFMSVDLQSVSVETEWEAIFKIKLLSFIQ